MTEELREKTLDILHKHYYPTMHESISDATLIDCMDEILKLLSDMGCGIWIEKELPILDDTLLQDIIAFRDDVKRNVLGITETGSDYMVIAKKTQQDMLKYIKECFTPIGTE